MAISSSLYSSISGLSTMGEAMSVVGDNVANLNTLAFKSSRATFQDVLAQSVSTASGTAQIGRGVTLSTVEGLFAQGSFESSTNATDMAIGGQGFFILRAPDASEPYHYSRAGEFLFDKEGNLVNPAGYFVQGWTIDQDTGDRQGTIGDINLGKSTPPVETSQVDVIYNLDADKPQEEINVNLFDAWDGRNVAAATPTPPIDPSNYEYTSAIKVYDSKGAGHDITIYFDTTTQENVWEFLVTCDPAEDKRNLDPSQQTIYAPDVTYNYENNKGAGALLYGTIEFNTNGDIKNIEAYDVPPDGVVDPALNTNRQVLQAGDNYYTFETNFTGNVDPNDPNLGNQVIKLNFGAVFDGLASFVPEALSSTQYSAPSTTIYQDQDGFASGFLQSVSVDTDGIITGHYSNGQVLKKAQVALAAFNSVTGLFKEGGNLFTETTKSGAPITGPPRTNGLGSIAPNSLEQSNVDLGNEFVKLITIERCFQANSKIITTTDEMLNDLINIKR